MLLTPKNTIISILFAASIGHGNALEVAVDVAKSPWTALNYACNMTQAHNETAAGQAGQVVCKSMPATSPHATNVFFQGLIEIMVVPYAHGFINPNDPVQMTVFRDIAMAPAVVTNVMASRPFRTGKFDPSHYWAHGLKIAEKLAFPYLLNSAGVELKTGVRISLYIADTTTRYWTNYGIAHQTNTPESLDLGPVEFILNEEHHSFDGFLQAVYEALPGSLVVVFINDKILTPLGVEAGVKSLVAGALTSLKIPGNPTAAISGQSLPHATGAAVKKFASIFSGKYVMGAICSTAALTIMTLVSNIEEGAAKTTGVLASIIALLYINHG